MPDKKTVSLVLPCHNEEEGIKIMLSPLPAGADEVIVVDNASTDGTAALAAGLGARVVAENRKGYGRACLAGIAAAKGDIIVLMDGDNSYPLSSIGAMTAYIEKDGFDLVSGCRYPLVDKKAQPFINRSANYIISLAVRKMFSVNLKNSQSGMMAFKNSLPGKLGPLGKGMGFSQEFKIKALREPGLRCLEVPIAYAPRLGKVKFSKIDAFKNLYNLVSLWTNLKIKKK